MEFVTKTLLTLLDSLRELTSMSTVAHSDIYIYWTYYTATLTNWLGFKPADTGG